MVGEVYYYVQKAISVNCQVCLLQLHTSHSLLSSPIGISSPQNIPPTRGHIPLAPTPATIIVLSQILNGTPNISLITPVIFRHYNKWISGHGCTLYMYYYMIIVL